VCVLAYSTLTVVLHSSHSGVKVVLKGCYQTAIGTDRHVGTNDGFLDGCLHITRQTPCHRARRPNLRNIKTVTYGGTSNFHGVTSNGLGVTEVL
jgi:hypothetical protein